MSLFGFLFVGLIWFLFCWDYVFYGKDLQRLLKIFLLAYVAVSLIVLFPTSIDRFRSFLGVGRTVDLVLYVVVAFLFREFLHSRAYRRKVEARFTILVRELAIQSAIATRHAEPDLLRSGAYGPKAEKTTE